MSKTWRERLADYRRSGMYTNEDHDALGRVVPALHEAHEPLCAIGEQMRAHDLSPSDGLLWDLGEQFCLAWYDRRFDACEELLCAIDDRVLMLKREAVSAEGGPR